MSLYKIYNKFLFYNFIKISIPIPIFMNVDIILTNTQHTVQTYPKGGEECNRFPYMIWLVSNYGKHNLLKI